MQGLQQAKLLWIALKAFVSGLATQLHVPQWVCCLDTCLKTFKEEKQLHVHAHVYLRNETQQFRCESSRKLKFMSSDPHVTTVWGKKVVKGDWVGAYYCLAPKLGSVFRHGSIERFRDFRVKPSWIFNTVECHEIGYEEARAELAHCGKGNGLSRLLADLDRWHIIAKQRCWRTSW